MKKKNKGITIIKKSNQLIESRYKFDIWETRVFLSVLSEIRKDDENFKTYRIWYKDVIKNFGLKSSQSYGFLRDAARGLMRKVFNISQMERGYRRETEFHIIRTVNYLAEGESDKSSDTQEYIDITVDPEMKPMLLQLQKNFTAYDLENVVRLGVYPVRVYELLKQYEGGMNPHTGIGERTLEVEEMKRMFELTTEYPLFANFFQKIIRPSLRDINLHTDLTITNLEQIKEGRKVVALRFQFVRKSAEELSKMRRKIAEQTGILPLPFPRMPKHAYETPEHSPQIIVIDPSVSAPILPDFEPIAAQSVNSVDSLFNQFQTTVVQDFGVSASVFLAELSGKTEAHVQKAIRVTEMARKKGDLKNPSGFFIKALRDNYTNEAEVKAEKQQSAKVRREKVLALKQEIEVLKDAQKEAIYEKIRVLTANKPEITEQAVENIRSNPFQEAYISELQKKLGRVLSLQDFRDDKQLRLMVIQTIFVQQQAEFTDINALFEAKITDIDKQIEKLK